MAEIGYHRGNTIYYEDEKFYVIITGDPNVPGPLITDDRVEAESEDALIKKIDAYYKRKTKPQTVLLKDDDKGVIKAILIRFGALGNPIIKRRKQPARLESKYTKVYELDRVLCREIQELKKQIDALESRYYKMISKLKIISPPSDD